MTPHKGTNLPVPQAGDITKEERRMRRRRRQSVAVLNDRIDSLKQEVVNLSGKFDEALLVCATVAGSIKLATRALGVIAFAAVVLVLGHSAWFEAAIKVIGKGLIP